MLKAYEYQATSRLWAVRHGHLVHMARRLSTVKHKAAYGIAAALAQIGSACITARRDAAYPSRAVLPLRTSAQSARAGSVVRSKEHVVCFGHADQFANGTL